MSNDTDIKRHALDTILRFLESEDHIAFNDDGDPVEIQLFQRGITDREMTCFRYFKEFVSIGLGGCSNVTDRGLQHLTHLRKLKCLDLHDTGITDDGLASLGELRELRYLNLVGCTVTDLGIAHLHGLIELEKLAIDENGISDGGYEQLMTALPDLKISNYL